MPPEIAALRDGAEPVWLFAYGSLMWNPEFAFAEARPALLHGYHRSFCLYSRDYRGTPEKPGLVLGLDRGGSCRGIAYRLPSGAAAPALDRDVVARDDRRGSTGCGGSRVVTREGDVAALACTVRRDSPDYAGRLSFDETAWILAHAVGGRGTRPRLPRQYSAPPRGTRHRRRPAAPDRREGQRAHREAGLVTSGRVGK